MEVVIASSPVDAGISCWDLHSGAEHLRHRSSASPPHGLTCVGRRFLASSQLRDSSSSSGSVFYWSWNKEVLLHLGGPSGGISIGLQVLAQEKFNAHASVSYATLMSSPDTLGLPQVGVKSFPAEPINPLVSNSDGTYIIGGGLSGDIYLWEIASGRLLKRWHAHYRAVTCLILSDDESLLISGSEDGCVRVWSLVMIFDDKGREEAKHPYEHSFSGHTLRVTSVISGYGGCNAIIVSSSEDRTCKIWSIAKGKLLRNISFPSIIDAIALDPGEHVFYAGSRDGKIYIAALNAESTSSSSYGMHIIGSLSDHSKTVTCLSFSMDGILLVSGSEDGMIRVWDTKTCNIVRLFKHAKGPVNNVLVVRQPPYLNPQRLMIAESLSKRMTLLPPPLDKYVNSMDENNDAMAVMVPQAPTNESLDASYVTVRVMKDQIKELQQQGSSAAVEMELERQKVDSKRSLQMVQKWEKMYEDLHHFCVNEMLDGGQIGGVNKQSI